MRTEEQLAEEARKAGLDPYAVAERAAIMEYDGGIPRYLAEDFALGKITWWAFHRAMKKRGAKL